MHTVHKGRAHPSTTYKPLSHGCSSFTVRAEKQPTSNLNQTPFCFIHSTSRPSQHSTSEIITEPIRALQGVFPSKSHEMSAEMTQTNIVPSQFLALSNELLMQILGYCLVFDKPITALMHSVYMARLIRLASINKRLYDLAMDVYWKENEFVIGLSKTNTLLFNPRRAMYSFKYPSPPVASLVRNLTVDLRFQPELYNGDPRYLQDIFKLDGDWLFLVPNRWKPSQIPLTLGKCTSDDTRIPEGTPASDPVRWQQYFHPQVLKIIVTLENDGKDETCFMARDRYSSGRWCGLTLKQRRKDAKKGLRGTSCNVDAKKIVVEVRGMECSGGDGSGICGGSCAKIIQETLQRMLRK